MSRRHFFSPRPTAQSCQLDSKRNSWDTSVLKGEGSCPLSRRRLLEPGLRFHATKKKGPGKKKERRADHDVRRRQVAISLVNDTHATHITSIFASAVAVDTINILDSNFGVYVAIVLVVVSMNR
jgi:hypothetical protein